MSKHTPGPWHVANGCQIRSDKHQVAKVWMMRDGEGLANAALMAEAPRLLEAVERLVNLNLPLTGNPTHEQLVEFWEYEKTVGRGEADDQLFVLSVLKAARGEA